MLGHLVMQIPYRLFTYNSFTESSLWSNINLISCHGKFKNYKKTRQIHLQQPNIIVFHQNRAFCSIINRRFVTLNRKN